MENQIAKTEKKQLTTKELFLREDVKSKFQELLGKRSTAYITSVMQITQSNELLKNAEPTSIYQSACIAAILDLPLNNTLGFAYIVPFNNRKNGIVEAQFQLGYKGFIQLAQRSGQVQTIASTPIYEGQLIEENPLTGFIFDFKKKESNKIIGYASYFKLLNGFEKTLYMSVDQVEKHAKRYSQTYKSGFGIWKNDFESMALKTVTKLLIAKYAPLSVEMQHALIADQSVIKDSNTMEVEYTDNESVNVVEFATQEQINTLNAYVVNDKLNDEQKALIAELLLKDDLTESEASQMIDRISNVIK